ncbi:MAG: extracellular solute-binding protein [Elusimicrobia bacterium]|nr:extracellular solute-binding protein [Elusimicrobiota bacterium]
MLRIVRLLIACALLVPFTSCSQNISRKADVVIWHWMTDRQAAFEKIAAQYEKETKVSVLFETYAPSEVYRDKVRAAATGKLLPEIFSTLGDKREVSSFINAGYIADLSADMQTGWKSHLFDKPLSQNTFPEGNEWKVKPGIYGVPIDVSAIMIYYNKDLFKQAGLDPKNPPQTWEAFLEAGRKLRAAGIQPFASGFSEGWLIGVFANSYAWNMLGEQGILDTIKGTIKYTDPRWLKVYQVFADMAKHDMFASGIATMVNKDAERTFATGKAAMALNGSWGVNVYFSMNPNLNYGVMMPPKMSLGEYPMRIFGGEGSSLNVNATSPNKDKAIAFLKWMTAKEQQIQLAQETKNIPSNQEAAGGLSDILKIFAQNIKNTFESLPVSESWQVNNVINTDMQAIIIGEKTIDQAAAEIQAEKMRQSGAK